MSVLERTDHDRATFAPLRITFGGEERDVKPLPIKLSRVWKKRLGETIGALASVDFDVYVRDESKPDDPNAKRLNMDGVHRIVVTLLEEAPEKATDVVFAYLKAADGSVDRTWFDDHVTDEEIAEALPLMIEVTVLPLVRKLGHLATVAQALQK